METLLKEKSKNVSNVMSTNSLSKPGNQHSSNESISIKSPKDFVSDEELLEIDATYCSHGDTIHYDKVPVIFRECDGTFMYSTDKTPYLDLQMWFASCNLGYKNKMVMDAVIDQMNTMPQVGSRWLYDYKALLSKRIAESIINRFGVKGRVHFNVGGSQATEDALKLVRHYTGKTRMFSFFGAYHGRTIGAASLTAGYRYREPFGHISDVAHFVPYPYCYRCPYGQHCDSCDMFCVKQLRREFEDGCSGLYNKKTHTAECGAFFIEPVQGSGGYIVPPKGYFKELKKVLDDFGVLLVDDEVQMGMFRTGKLWAIEHFDVKPDVMTFSKSLTNGMNPLSAMWAKEEIINPEMWPAGSTHSTFCNNPIGMRAGYTVVNYMEENRETLEKEVAAKGKYFLDGLKELEKKHKRIGTVDGLGLALRVECVTEDGYTPDPALLNDVVKGGLKGDLSYKGKKCGIILNTGAHYKNSITLVPPITISYSEIDMAIELIDQLFTRYS